MRHLEDEAGRLAEILARDDRGESVDMAGDHMAAEFVAKLQRALEIDARAGIPVRDLGQCQGLRRRLDVETRAAFGLGIKRNHREADAGAGDRGADGDRRRVIGAVDGDAMHVVAPLDGGHGADIGDDPGEHGQVVLSKRIRRSSPSDASSTMR